MFLKQQRLKHKSARMLTSIQEPKDAETVCSNRKERRKGQSWDGLPSHSSSKPETWVGSSSTKVSSDVNEVPCKSTEPSDSSNESMDELEDGELETSDSECSDDAASTEEVVVGAEGIVVTMY
jgi:hypothetical protein